MSGPLPIVERQASADFAVARDASCRALLQKWEWFHVFLAQGDGSWEEQVEWTRGAVEALLDKLSAPRLDVILSVYGQFLPDGVIAVANALIDTDSDARFYVAPVKSVVPVAGYVTSFINVECKSGFISRIFDRAGPVLVGWPNFLSVYVMPKEHFEEVLECSFALYSLDGERLMRGAERILSL